MHIKLIILWKILLFFGCACACSGRDYNTQSNSAYRCDPQVSSIQKQSTQPYYQREQQPQLGPQSIRQSNPQSIPQSNPQSIPQSNPRSIQQSNPRSIQQSNPQSIPQSNPHSIPQSIPHSIPQTRPQPTPKTSRNLNPFYGFSTKLFNLIAPINAQRNIVFSPLSLHTLLSFLYMGAEGHIAQQLRDVLEMPEMLSEVARLFRSLQQHMEQQSSSEMQLHMANKMYYNNHFRLNRDFYKQLKPYFDAEAEPVPFIAPQQAAAQINAWVADKTNQRIQQIVVPSSLNADTTAILVNAIYMKAKWAKQFSTFDTQSTEFHVTNTRSVPVEMMYIEDVMNYAELPSLNARAVELAFDGSDLSMLIILPNEIEGLLQLEYFLGNTDLNTVISGLQSEKLTLRLPRFVYEFEMDVSTPLKMLGLESLFHEHANLTRFFGNQNVRISKIQHKAYINVNEGGVEAAAASFAKLIPLALPVQVNYFTIDHPFMYVIRSPYAIYFIGHVVKP